MGTRNLTVVKLDNEYRIAQYGRWDGYPEGAGVTVLNFARKLAEGTTMQEFIHKVRASRWVDAEKVKKITRKEKWHVQYPEFSRDTGAQILDVVLYSVDGIELESDIEFAADSLFCEWAWVIDLDAKTLEGYKGFNDHTALRPDDRFYFLRDKERNEFHGVLLSAKWSLDDLPSDEKFIAAFDDED